MINRICRFSSCQVIDPVSSLYGYVDRCGALAQWKMDGNKIDLN